MLMTTLRKLGNIMIKDSVLILSIIFLTSCSVVTEKKCLQTDWYEQGRQDGLYHRSGYQNNLFVTECSQKYNVDADKQAYDIGYEQGIKGSCTREWAESQGVNNNNFDSSLCPYAVGDIVRKAYTDGRVQGLTREITQLERTLLKTKSQPAAYETRLSLIESQLERENLGNSNLTHELSYLKSDIDRLTSKISHLTDSSGFGSPKQYFGSEDLVTTLTSEVEWLKNQIKTIYDQQSDIAERFAHLQRVLDNKPPAD